MVVQLAFPDRAGPGREGTAVSIAPGRQAGEDGAPLGASQSSKGKECGLPRGLSVAKTRDPPDGRPLPGAADRRRSADGNGASDLDFRKSASTTSLTNIQCAYQQFPVLASVHGVHLQHFHAQDRQPHLIHHRPCHVAPRSSPSKPRPNAPLHRRSSKPRDRSL